MALPSSGQISIDQIRNEIGVSTGSLRSLSASAGKSTPDAMSEFHGYSHLVEPPSAYSGYITSATSPRGGYRLRLSDGYTTTDYTTPSSSTIYTFSTSAGRGLNITIHQNDNWSPGNNFIRGKIGSYSERNTIPQPNYSGRVGLGVSGPNADNGSRLIRGDMGYGYGRNTYSTWGNNSGGRKQESRHISTSVGIPSGWNQKVIEAGTRQDTSESGGGEGENINYFNKVRISL
jgi:hypothetical protein